MNELYSIDFIRVIFLEREAQFRLIIAVVALIYVIFKKNLPLGTKTNYNPPFYLRLGYIITIYLGSISLTHREPQYSVCFLPFIMISPIINYLAMKEKYFVYVEGKYTYEEQVGIMKKEVSRNKYFAIVVIFIMMIIFIDDFFKVFH